MTAACYDWPTSTTHGNYRSCIYSMASVMQREREAIDVGALTNMAAGEIKLLSLVMLQSQSRNCYEIQPHEYLT